jgi:hypothetical protein
LRNLLNNGPSLKGERLPFWRRKIALPVPALALMVLLLVALSLWAVYWRKTKSTQATEIILPQGASKPSEPAANPFDMSRFDKGGRAVIYTEQRASTNNQPQKENKQ